jgi:hypothetical protein
MWNSVLDYLSTLRIVNPNREQGAFLRGYLFSAFDHTYDEYTETREIDGEKMRVWKSDPTKIFCEDLGVGYLPIE